MTADGLLTFTLIDQIDHTFGDNVETNLPIDLAGVIQVVDEDGDALVADTGDFVINVGDDIPQQITPQSATLENSPSGTATANLDEDGNIDDDVGQDQIGTITFANITNGQDSGLTSGGDPIRLFLVDNDANPTNDGTDPPTLEGRIGGPAGTLIFTITLNHDATNLANDTYTVDMSGTVDNGSGVTFNDLSGGEAGNPPFKLIPSTSADNLELLFTPINETSINSDSDDVGVGGQFIRIANPDQGLRIDFGDFTSHPNGGGTSDNGFTIDQHLPVNGFRFTIDQVSIGQIADVQLKAYNANEGVANQSPINGTAPGGQHNFGDDPLLAITEIQIFDNNGVSLGTFNDDANIPQPIEGINIDFLVTGAVNITGLREGYRVLTRTASGYDRIEITNIGTLGGNDGQFSLSNLQVSTVNTGAPIDTAFDLALTDADGDTVVPGAITVHLEPRPVLTVVVAVDDALLNDSDGTSTVTFTFSEAPGASFTESDIHFGRPHARCRFADLVDATHYTATFTATDGFDGIGGVSVLAGSYTNSRGGPRLVPAPTSWRSTGRIRPRGRHRRRRAERRRHQLGCDFRVQRGAGRQLHRIRHPGLGRPHARCRFADPGRRHALHRDGHRERWLYWQRHGLAGGG